jgi:hypothetical protein
MGKTNLSRKVGKEMSFRKKSVAQNNKMKGFSISFKNKSKCE